MTDGIKAALRGPNATWFKIGIGVLPLVFGMGVAWATLGGSVDAIKTIQVDTTKDIKEIRGDVKKLELKQAGTDERFNAIMDALKDIKEEIRENRKQMKGKKQ